MESQGHSIAKQKAKSGLSLTIFVSPLQVKNKKLRDPLVPVSKAQNGKAWKIWQEDAQQWLAPGCSSMLFWL